MIEKPDSEVFVNWRDAAFNPNADSEPRILHVMNDGEYGFYGVLTIERRAVKPVCSERPQKPLHLLEVSLHHEPSHGGDVPRPQQSGLLKHVSLLLGEVHAAASFEVDSQPDLYKVVRLILLGDDNRPVLVTDIVPATAESFE